MCRFGRKPRKRIHFLNRKGRKDRKENSRKNDLIFPSRTLRS
jgi:hypothetical protein